MKKVIRFVVAWTTGLAFISMCAISIRIAILIWWLAENETEMRDMLDVEKEMFYSWWKWASFKEMK